jgi:hypothetical protein
VGNTLSLIAQNLSKLRLFERLRLGERPMSKEIKKFKKEQKAIKKAARKAGKKATKDAKVDRTDPAIKTTPFPT